MADDGARRFSERLAEAAFALDRSELGDEMACRTSEHRWVSARLDELYRRVRRGDNSVLTRQRIARWEALMQAAVGDPSALAQ